VYTVHLRLAPENVYAVHINGTELVMITRPWLFALTFLAFPPAGLIARAVAGPVDSPPSGALAGVIVGVVVGAAQWLVLRPTVRAWWIAATAGALGSGLALAAAIGLTSSERGDLLAFGIVCGALVGAAQGLLMPSGRRLMWGAAVALLWPLAWQITAAVGVDLSQGWAVFGAAGAVTFSSALAALLAMAGRRADVAVAA